LRILIKVASAIRPFIKNAAGLQRVITAFPDALEIFDDNPLFETFSAKRTSKSLN
jgi:hypothetical protein